MSIKSNRIYNLKGRGRTFWMLSENVIILTDFSAKNLHIHQIEK